MEIDTTIIYKKFCMIIENITSDSDKNTLMYLLSINTTLSKEQRIELAKRLSSKVTVASNERSEFVIAKQ